MHAPGGTLHIEQPLKLFACRFHKDSLSLAVQTSHSANVAVEVAFNNEVCKHRLIEHGGVAIYDRSRAAKRLDEVRRQNDAPEAERREQRLAEAAHV